MRLYMCIAIILLHILLFHTGGICTASSTAPASGTTDVSAMSFTIPTAVATKNWTTATKFADSTLMSATTALTTTVATPSNSAEMTWSSIETTPKAKSATAFNTEPSTMPITTVTLSKTKPTTTYVRRLSTTPRTTSLSTSTTTTTASSRTTSTASSRTTSTASSRTTSTASSTTSKSEVSTRDIPETSSVSEPDTGSVSSSVDISTTLSENDTLGVPASKGQVEDLEARLLTVTVLSAVFGSLCFVLIILLVYLHRGQILLRFRKRSDSRQDGGRRKRDQAIGSRVEAGLFQNLTMDNLEPRPISLDDGSQNTDYQSKATGANLTTFSR